MPRSLPPAPPAAVSPATPRRRWTDQASPGGAGRARAAVVPEPGGPLFEENGLRIQLLPAGVCWAPLLSSDGRPLCVTLRRDGSLLQWRPLPVGADWRAMEDEAHDALACYLRRRRAGLTLL